jgi:hypothetical protein
MARYSCPFLTKCGVFQKIFLKVPNNKFKKMPFGSRAEKLGQTERWTDVRELVGPFRYVCERA